MKDEGFWPRRRGRHASTLMVQSPDSTSQGLHHMTFQTNKLALAALAPLALVPALRRSVGVDFATVMQRPGVSAASFEAQPPPF